MHIVADQTDKRPQSLLGCAVLHIRFSQYSQRPFETLEVVGSIGWLLANHASLDGIIIKMFPFLLLLLLLRLLPVRLVLRPFLTLVRQALARVNPKRSEVKRVEGTQPWAVGEDLEALCSRTAVAMRLGRKRKLTGGRRWEIEGGYGKHTEGDEGRRGKLQGAKGSSWGLRALWTAGKALRDLS